MQSSNDQGSDSPGSKAAPRSAGLFDFVKQAMKGTAWAFSAPVVVAGMFAPKHRGWFFIPAGLVFAYIRNQPQRYTYQPTLTTKQAMTAAGLGFSPFLFLLPLHARHMASPKGQSRKAMLESYVDNFIARKANMKPSGAMKYPLYFTLGRVGAQLSSAAIGSGLAYGYVTQEVGGRPSIQGDGIVKQSAPIEKTLLSALTAATLFSVPAILAHPKVPTEYLKFLGPAGSVRHTAAIVSGLVGAAMGTYYQIVKSNQLPAIETGKDT